MCATKKQSAANRRNAQKSTGPQTEAGKAASSQNSLKHGLYSGNVIINSPYLQESQAEYDALVESLAAELHPEGVLQNLIVQKIAECFWRRRRLINAETAEINRQLHSLDTDMALSNAIRLMGPKRFIPPQDKLDDMISIKSIPKESTSLYMLRYEMRLDRQLTNSLRLLTQLQKQAADRKDINQPYEDQGSDHPCDSIQVAPRHLPPRQHPSPACGRGAGGEGLFRANGEGGETKDEHSNPTGTSRLPGGIPSNPNGNIDLDENSVCRAEPEAVLPIAHVGKTTRHAGFCPTSCDEGAGGEGGETINEHSNPIPSNPNDHMELEENPDAFNLPASGHPTASPQGASGTPISLGQARSYTN